MMATTVHCSDEDGNNNDEEDGDNCSDEDEENGKMATTVMRMGKMVMATLASIWQ